MILTTITRTTDLSIGVMCEPLHNAFLMGDQEAHRFVVRLVRSYSGGAVSLTGAGVQGFFLRRGDGATVVIDGESDGNQAIVTLPSACYAVPGRFSFIVRVTLGDTVHSVLWCEGTVTRARTDTLIDPGDVIPTLDELLARISALEAATEAAQEIVSRDEQAAGIASAGAAIATEKANEATQAAAQAQDAATNAAGSESSALSASAEARAAANRAADAADRAESAGGGTVSPEDIAQAVEDYLTENPIEVTETDPTVPDWAKQPEKPTYTPEEIGAQPAGDYALKSDLPEVPVQSVNGQTGEVVLSAADVGALPDDTAIPEPYTLPTASATEKGGVMIGEGIDVDADGRITTAMGAQWEFIAEATVEETDVTYLEISEDADGSPLSLRQVAVLMDVYPALQEGSSPGAHYRISVDPDLTQPAYVWGNGSSKFSTPSEEGQHGLRMWMAAVANDGSILPLNSMISVNTTTMPDSLGYGSGTMPENYVKIVPKYVSNPKITCVKLGSYTAAIGVGTNVKVYGVKA